MPARLAQPHESSRAVWAVAALAVLCVWAWRAHRAVAADDWTAAFALTGLTACLVSPLTWVHHVVWLLPSFAVLLHRRRLRTAAVLCPVLCSSVVWLSFHDASGIDGFLGSNTYTWITFGLLLRLPVGQSRVTRPPLSRSASATPPAPRPAAHPIPAAAGQSGSSPVDNGVAAAEAGVVGRAAGPDRGTALELTSDPTGSTRPAAPKPQSSSERASSYTVNPPPA